MPPRPKRPRGGNLEHDPLAILQPGALKSTMQTFDLTPASRAALLRVERRCRDLQVMEQQHAKQQQKQPNQTHPQPEDEDDPRDQTHGEKYSVMLTMGTRGTGSGTTSKKLDDRIKRLAQMKASVDRFKALAVHISLPDDAGSARPLLPDPRMNVVTDSSSGQSRHGGRASHGRRSARHDRRDEEDDGPPAWLIRDPSLPPQPLVQTQGHDNNDDQRFGDVVEPTWDVLELETTTSRSNPLSIDDLGPLRLMSGSKLPPITHWTMKLSQGSP
ncbi:hypothetical protein BC828DRAFT_383654 [Blastocladiella britannica]|nr:hypothetical protein BC828DRAFT_383654 [Blastocladiella britannica]